MSGTYVDGVRNSEVARESSTLSRMDLVKYRKDASFTWAGFEGLNTTSTDGMRRSAAVITEGFEMENFA